MRQKNCKQSHSQGQNYLWQKPNFCCVGLLARVVIAAVFLSAALRPSPAFAVPVLQIELQTDALKGNSSTGKISFVAVGQISGKRIWLNDQWNNLDSFEDFSPNKSNQNGMANQNSQSGQLTPDQPKSSEGGSGGLPAKFGISTRSDGGCADDRRIRDLLYLIRSLGKSVGSVEIAHSGAAEKCVTSLSRQMISFGLAARVTSQAEASGATSPVMIRIFFIESESNASTDLKQENSGSSPELPQNNGHDSAGSAGSLGSVGSTASPAGSPPTAPQNTSLRVYLDNRPVAVDRDGWFAASFRSGNAADIEVKAGNRSVFKSKIDVYVLNQGVNSNYKSERYMAVELIAGKNTKVSIIEMTPQEVAGPQIEISVPVFVKVGLGYTLLTPLPTEKERDRSTILLALRSYPLFDRYHLAAEVITSLKSASRIPWTVLGTFLAGTDLIQFRGNWSMPVGVGVRLFQSSIKQRPSDAATGNSIRIPEAVLGLAAQIGASYRSGLFYAELSGSVTPVFADGASPIVTFNPMFATGYQISRIDIVSLSLMNQDIRYPSVQGEAKVVSSSMILGYQRDFL